MPRNCYLNTRTYVTRRTPVSGGGGGGSLEGSSSFGVKEIAKVPGERGESRARFEGPGAEKSLRHRHNSLSRYSFRNFASIIARRCIRVHVVDGTRLWLRKNIVGKLPRRNL